MQTERPHPATACLREPEAGSVSGNGEAHVGVGSTGRPPSSCRRQAPPPGPGLCGRCTVRIVMRFTHQFGGGTKKGQTGMSVVSMPGTSSTGGM